jgi:membrane-bound lytic murein transglycosylase A
MTLRFQPKYVSLFLVCLFLASAAWYFFLKTDSYKPLHHISPDKAPVFTDDMGYNSFLSASRSHADYLKNRASYDLTAFGQVNYSADWLFESIHIFTEKIKENPDQNELQQFILENYDIYQAGGRENKRKRQMLVTGYYEPLFEGSLVKTKPYLYPIYSSPEDLVNEKSGNSNHPRIGRIADKGFTSYWSRAEIETLNIAQGYELVYLKDPFDAFLLHVQGSGRIRLPDKSIRTIQFAGSNGLEYNSVGKLLVDEKRMDLTEVTVPAIRNYLKQHPEQLHRILHHNPRFIFFNWGNDLGPKGSSGAILTPGRSIAIDNSVLPDSAIGYITTQKPEVNQQGEIVDWVPLNRFVFPQDSGAAIKGAGRVDLFWGHGYYAELAASHMKEDGKLYFLVKKREQF